MGCSADPEMSASPGPDEPVVKRITTLDSWACLHSALGAFLCSCNGTPEQGGLTRPRKVCVATRRQWARDSRWRGRGGGF